MRVYRLLAVALLATVSTAATTHKPFSTLAASSTSQQPEFYSNYYVSSVAKAEFGGSLELQKLAQQYLWEKNSNASSEQRALYMLHCKSASSLTQVANLGNNAFLIKADVSGYPFYRALLTYSEATAFEANSDCDVAPITGFGKMSSRLFESSGNLNPKVFSVDNSSSSSEGQSFLNVDLASLHVRLGKDFIADARSLGEKWRAWLEDNSKLEELRDSLFWMHIQSTDNKTKDAIEARRREWNSRFDEIVTASQSVNFSKITVESTSTGVVFANIQNAFDNVKEVQVVNAAMLWLTVLVSSQPEVLFLQDIPKVRQLNNNAVWIVQSGSQGSTPIFNKGLKGDDQIVAVADTGLDQYSCYFYDSTNGATPTSSADDPQTYSDRRKVVQYVAFGDSSDAPGGHGTHVSGTIVGATESSSNSGSTYDGLAPNGKIAFFDIASGSSNNLAIPSDLKGTLLPPGYNAGARVHSASWGSTTTTYSSLDEDFDDFMHSYPGMLIVVAAGNCGESSADCSSYGFYSVGSPAVAKNIISVGASMNYGTGSIDYVAYFSSRGPTPDGRIKPDLVGPGFSLTSAKGSGTSAQTCATESLAGTSMATPTIAASALLVREYFIKGFYPSGSANDSDSYSPSAALVKAMLINGAVGMSGVLNSDGTVTKLGNPPDYYQGFGRVNLENSLPFGQLSMVVIDFKELVQGDVYQFNITVISASESISITLCWTDPASSSGALSNLVNDLDLSVQSANTSTVYYPNGKSSADHVNNVEKIKISGASVGETFIVTVTGYSVQGSQHFALVATGIFNSTESGTLLYTGSAAISASVNLLVFGFLLVLCVLSVLHL
jgi:hypothetical protein